jgi:hypothetical protein
MTADILVFLISGATVTFGAALIGFALLRLIELRTSRTRMWGAIADWAAANEAASTYRTAVRRERPWREWTLRLDQTEPERKER